MAASVGVWGASLLLQVVEPFADLADQSSIGGEVEDESRSGQNHHEVLHQLLASDELGGDEVDHKTKQSEMLTSHEFSRSGARIGYFFGMVNV